jgi:pyruvate dehydrogenase E1 component alpha subunit
VRWPGNRPLWPQLLTGETDVAYAWDPERIPVEHEKWWARQDGLLRFLRELLGAGLLTPGDASAIDTQARAEMAGAMTFALQSPFPRPEEALEHVFA